MKVPSPQPAGRVLGFEIAPIALDDAAAWLLARSLRRGGEPALVVTLNPEIVVRARRDPALAAALAGAELTVADGVGILWAARRAGVPLPGRVPGVELSFRTLELGGPDLSVFFLGAAPGVAEQAAAVAHERWGTGVAGWAHGYFDRENGAAEVAAQVRASGANLLLAGLGEGQELFLHRHAAGFGVGAMVGVGGTLDVLAGRVRRTPAWTRRLGVEWLWRVGLDPARWHRFPRLLRFAAMVLAEPHEDAGARKPGD